MTAVACANQYTLESERGFLPRMTLGRQVQKQECPQGAAPYAPSPHLRHIGHGSSGAYPSGQGGMSATGEEDIIWGRNSFKDG